MFLNFILLEHLPNYSSMYLVSSYKILARFDVQFKRYAHSRKTGQQTF